MSSDPPECPRHPPSPNRRLSTPLQWPSPFPLLSSANAVGPFPTPCLHRTTVFPAIPRVRVGPTSHGRTSAQGFLDRLPEPPRSGPDVFGSDHCSDHRRTVRAGGDHFSDVICSDCADAHDGKVCPRPELSQSGGANWLSRVGLGRRCV